MIDNRDIAINNSSAHTPEKIMKNRSRTYRMVIGMLSIVGFLLIWELLVRFNILHSVFLPSPSSICTKTLALFADGTLVKQTSISLYRILGGFSIGSLIGVSIAFLCQMSPIVEAALAPIVELVRGIAPLALLPLFLLFFGIGDISKIAIITWVVWVPVFVNTLEGMKNIDALLYKAARSFGSSKLQIALKVTLPSATPFILSGLRLGMGSAFLVLVAAEMLGSNSGLGFYILETSQTFKIVEMYSAIFVIGFAGLVINGLFILVVGLFTPWYNLSK